MAEFAGLARRDSARAACHQAISTPGPEHGDIAPMTASGPPALPDEGPPSGGSLPAKLEQLVETARAYARAATSQEHQPGLRRGLARLFALARPPGPRPQAARRPRMRRPLSARRSRPAPRAQAARPGPSPRSSAGSRRSGGISPRGPCPSTARTAMSRPCSPACGAPMASRPSRRRRSCRSMSWPCSTSSPRRAYGTCATGRSSSSASPAACAARRSPAS